MKKLIIREGFREGIARGTMAELTHPGKMGAK